MEKISKEYYEKLRTINYSKVEITLYNKLKDYGIWWVKNRVEDTENYYLYFEDKIKYLKKHIREFLEKQIKEYNEKDFNLIYNEKFEKYEAEYKKENIPMIFHYNEYNEELNGIEISYKKETFFIEIPQQDDYSFYNDYLNPSPPFSWEDYFKKNYIKLLRNKYITRNRKLSILLIKININLYRRVLMKYKAILAGN